MKKSILTLSITILLFASACKKETVNQCSNILRKETKTEALTNVTTYFITLSNHTKIEVNSAVYSTLIEGNEYCDGDKINQSTLKNNYR